MKVTFDQLGGEGATREDAAVVFVISDALGDAAQSVVISAASQFSDGAVRVVRLSQIKSADEVRDYFDAHDEDFVSTAVFHSIVDPVLRRSVKEALNERGITSVDILGPVVQILAGLTGETPKNIASAHHRVDSRYLRRVAAMEYFVDHDNGKNPQDLGEADVVLVGLTGSAKSPLAMHSPSSATRSRASRSIRAVRFPRSSRRLTPTASLASRPRPTCSRPRACVTPRGSSATRSSPRSRPPRRARAGKWSASDASA